MVYLTGRGKIKFLKAYENSVKSAKNLTQSSIGSLTAPLYSMLLSKFFKDNNCSTLFFPKFITN